MVLGLGLIGIIGKCMCIYIHILGIYRDNGKQHGNYYLGLGFTAQGLGSRGPPLTVVFATTFRTLLQWEAYIT